MSGRIGTSTSDGVAFRVTVPNLLGGTTPMETTIDSAFIRRAVEYADLNAVRVALYQHTGDPEIAALPTAINLDDEGRELLISKAAAWLEQHAGPGMPAEPPEAELR